MGFVHRGWSAYRAIAVAHHSIIHPGPGAEKIHDIYKMWWREIIFYSFKEQKSLVPSPMQGVFS